MTSNGFTRMTRGIARRSCQSARDKSNRSLEAALDYHSGWYIP